MADIGSRRILCIGGATIDRKYRAHSALRAGTSNPARGERGFGGVARNVAENLARLGTPAALVTAVGDDEGGRILIRHLDKAGVEVHLVEAVPSQGTAEYVAVLTPDGDLALGIADMDVFENLTAARLDAIWPDIAGARWIFADCNLPGPAISLLMSRRRRHGFSLAVDGVSTRKVSKLPPDLSGIDVLFLNRDEAVVLVGDETLSLSGRIAALMARGAGAVVETQGKDGVAVGTSNGLGILPAVPAEIADVTGAGDALAAATLDGLARGLSLHEAAKRGTLAAALTIESFGTVRRDLSPTLMRSALHRLGTTDPGEAR